MNYDETQLAYWIRREAEERVVAGNTTGVARLSHSGLADTYAGLILQKAGETAPETLG